MHRSRILLVTLCLAVPIALDAQDPRMAPMIAKSRAALAPLANLVGEWEGDAKAMTGPGQSITVRQHENVRWVSNGTALLVQGTGRSIDPADKGKIVFEATAIIWYDIQTDKVRMRTFKDGGSVEPELEFRTDTLIWGFPTEGGRVRYTIAYDKDRWHEVGHFLRAGAPPVLTVDMPLTRVKAQR